MASSAKKVHVFPSTGIRVDNPMMGNVPVGLVSDFLEFLYFQEGDIIQYPGKVYLEYGDGHRVDVTDDVSFIPEPGTPYSSTMAGTHVHAEYGSFTNAFSTFKTGYVSGIICSDLPGYDTDGDFYHNNGDTLLELHGFETTPIFKVLARYSDAYEQDITKVASYAIQSGMTGDIIPVDFTTKYNHDIHYHASLLCSFGGKVNRPIGLFFTYPDEVRVYSGTDPVYVQIGQTIKYEDLCMIQAKYGEEWKTLPHTPGETWAPPNYTVVTDYTLDGVKTHVSFTERSQHTYEIDGFTLKIILPEITGIVITGYMPAQLTCTVGQPIPYHDHVYRIDAHYATGGIEITNNPDVYSIPPGTIFDESMDNTDVVISFGGKTAILTRLVKSAPPTFDHYRCSKSRLYFGKNESISLGNAKVYGVFSDGSEIELTDELQYDPPIGAMFTASMNNTTLKGGNDQYPQGGIVLMNADKAYQLNLSVPESGKYFDIGDLIRYNDVSNITIKYYNSGNELPLTYTELSYDPPIDTTYEKDLEGYMATASFSFGGGTARADVYELKSK